MKKKIKEIKRKENKKKIKCPFCGRELDYKGIICRCEVEGTGMEEFWIGQ